MQVKKLLEIVVKAQEIHEASWSKFKDSYLLTVHESLEQAFGKPASDCPEFDLACFLFNNAYNDSQDWLENIKQAEIAAKGK